MVTVTVKILDDLWKRAGNPKEELEDTLRGFFLAGEGSPEFQQIIFDFDDDFER